MEIPRKLRDILNVTHSILCPTEEPLKIGKVSGGFKIRFFFFFFF